MIGVNRKRRKKMHGLLLQGPYTGLIVLFAFMALAYVWIQCRCEALGRDIKQLEKDKERLTKQYLYEEFRWSRMRSPREVERAIEAHNLAMTWPRVDQIVRMGDGKLSDSLAGNSRRPGGAIRP